MAHVVGEQLAAGCQEGWTILHAHQLFPEHAELMGEFDRTLVVDASVEELEEPRIRRVYPDPEASMGLHGLTLDTLYGLALWLHGTPPHLWICSIPIRSCGHGDELSPIVKALIPTVIPLIQEWADRELDTPVIL